MAPRRTRPLRLEPVEDRCLPSAFHGGLYPSAHEPRHGEYRFTDRHADAAPLRADRFEATTVVWVPLIWLSVPTFRGDVPPRSDQQPELRPVADQAESSAASPRPTRALAAAQPISVALPTGGSQVTVNSNATSAIEERPANALPWAPDGSRSATSDAPAAGVVFYGVAVPSEVELPVAVPTPVPPVEVPTPPELPTPREVVERVFDALLPVGVPLAGVVPFEAEALDTAAELIAKLPTLAPNADSQDGWASPERWAWVTAGVLVAGGAAYAARGANARRALAPALGADSALARWEDRRDRNPAA